MATDFVLAAQDARQRYVGKMLATRINPFGAVSNNSPNGWCIGYDPVDSVMWYVNGTGIYISGDYGATSRLAGPLPTNFDSAHIVKIVRFGNYCYLYGRDSTDTAAKIVRSAPATAAAGTDFSWSAPVLTTTANNTIGTDLQADASYMYHGEYRTSGTPLIWRLSLANANGAGTAWETVWTGTGQRHVHSVKPDPYNPGLVFATVGDGLGVALMRSADYGATWTTVQTSGSLQGVQISYDARWVYIAGDTASVTLMVYDRTGAVAKSGAKNWHGNLPVPGGAGSRTVTDLATKTNTTALASPLLGATAADVGRRITAAVPSSGVPFDVYIAAFASTTIAAASNGATLPQATITVADTSTFASTALNTGGLLMISTDAGVQVVTYTNKTGTTFTGCTGGTGTMSTGAAVTQIQMSTIATATTTGNAAEVWGDTFYGRAYYGCVDPSTGVYYCVANDISGPGTKTGLFWLPSVGDALQLIATRFIGVGEVFIAGGYLHTAYWRVPLMVT